MVNSKYEKEHSTGFDINLTLMSCEDGRLYPPWPAARRLDIIVLHCDKKVWGFFFFFFFWGGGGVNNRLPQILFTDSLEATHFAYCSIYRPCRLALYMDKYNLSVEGKSRPKEFPKNTYCNR